LSPPKLLLVCPRSVGAARHLKRYGITLMGTIGGVIVPADTRGVVAQPQRESGSLPAEGFEQGRAHTPPAFKDRAFRPLLTCPEPHKQKFSFSKIFSDFFTRAYAACISVPCTKALSKTYSRGWFLMECLDTIKHSPFPGCSAIC